MKIEECYYLGYTSKAHGKEGELIIKPDVDSPEEYTKLESVFIQINKKDNVLVPFFITNSILLNNGTLRFKIDGVDSIEEAKNLLGKEVYLPLSLLPVLKGNKFYYHEIIGFTVIDNEKGAIGKITNVLNYPQQDIFEIRNNTSEILIPITDKVIENVDREKKIITVSAPEGLIDLYTETSI